ncbi:C40 family peptidase [Paenibacillus sp. GCM10027626]|uniref:C40 family peptidase n=1 Tax=Paenibacillus sp. GCM10027626 TaxID=3273411 RepID=UPI003636859A
MRTISLKKIIAATVCFGVILSANAIVAPKETYAATSTSAKAAGIISTAQALKGKVKYKFGVNNPSKYIFDCSSFTKYVFAKHGVKLTWGSKAQSKQGKFVSKSNLRKGDLVFFSVSKPGQVNHVGIYIGNGKFIHNTIGSKVNGVIVSNLSSYSKRYITARRVL